MHAHYPFFISQGYKTLDKLFTLTDESLKQLEIPLGFRIKFNKLRAEQLEKTINVPTKAKQASRDQSTGLIDKKTSEGTSTSTSTAPVLSKNLN